MRLRCGCARAVANVRRKLWDAGTPGKAASSTGSRSRRGLLGLWDLAPAPRCAVDGDRPDDAKLAERQRQQLDVICGAIRPGGTLVYTVATVTRRRPMQ